MGIGTLSTAATMAALAGGGTTIAGIPDIVRSGYEREQAKELARMKRKQEMDALGLSEEERRALEQQLGAKSAQSERFAQAERERLLTAGGAQAGQALLAETIQSDQAQRQAQALQAQIESEDIRQTDADKQYIRDLEAAQARYKKKRQEALVAPIAAAGMAGLQGLTFQQLAGLSPERQAEMAALGVPVPAASDPATEAIKGYMKQYGLSQEEAKKLYQDFDEADSYYMDLL